MYLGNSTIAHEKTYFLPLLPHWEKKAQAGDKSLASRVEALRELPMITIVTNEASHGLPQIAKSLFSHGGYKIILANTESNELILVIRDVESTSTDDAGRKTPFLLAVVGTTEDEKRLLEFCRVPRTRKEIIDFLGIASGQYALKRYLDPLVQAGAIRLTMPETPRSPHQQYFTAAKRL